MAIIGISKKHNVRIYFANTTDLVNKATKIFNLAPTSSAALGRNLSITALMGLMLKNEDDQVTTIINGNGSAGTIMSISRSDGSVKGFIANRDLYLKYNHNNKLAVGLVIGNEGYLRVIKRTNNSNFTGQVELLDGEIAKEYSYYFLKSEQCPSVVSCGVLVEVDYSIKAAGAIIIQLLPNSSEEDLIYLEKIAHKFENISTKISENKDYMDIILPYFDDFEVLKEKELHYHCDCHKEKFISSLLTLSREDLNDLFKEQNEIEVCCEFCDKKYIIQKDEIFSCLN